MKLFFTTLLLMMLCACPLMQSQSLTTVTIVLTDSQGQVWANASYTAQIQPPFGNPNPLQNNGGPIQVPVISGFADGTGTITVNLDTNTIVSPSGSTYKLTVCPNASVTNCSNSIIVTTGLTQDLSGSVSADLVPISISPQPNISRAYTDAESVNPPQAAIYWRVSDNHLRGFNGSSWQDIGGGSISSSSKWSDLLAPTANTSIGFGNFSTLFTYGSSTGNGVPMLELLDNSGNTGTNFLFRVRSNTTSTANPFEACVKGTTDCVSINSSAVMQALGIMQIIATSVVSNATGVGEIFLGSNGSGVPSGTNQVAIMGNSNKLYASENSGTMAKIILGGQVNAAAGKALASLDVNGVETDITIPSGFSQVQTGASSTFTLNNGVTTVVTVTLNGSFPNTTFFPVCSLTISNGSGPQQIQTAIPASVNSVTVTAYNNTGSSIANDVINCIAVK